MSKTTAVSKIRKELEHQEAIIRDGMKSFLFVGQALITIREQQLYKDDHKTFESYCQERWQFGRSYANKLIEAAAVVTNLGTIVPKTGGVLPSNESQARALATSTDDAEQQQQVWTEVVKRSDGKPITAKVIEQVADEILPPKVETKPEPKRDKRTEFKPEEYEEPDPVSQFDPDAIDGVKESKPDDKAKSKIDHHATHLLSDVQSLVTSLERLMNSVDAYHAKTPIGNHKSFCAHYQRAHTELNEALATVTQLERAWRFGGK